MSEPLWPTALLGDAVDVLDHLRVPVNEEERAKRLGDVPYYGANGPQGWIDRPLFNEPLLLMAEDGGYFDEFATRPIAYRVDGPSWVNNHAHILRAKPEFAQAFVFWNLVHKDIRRHIAGGTRDKLTQGALRAIEIPNPPLPEQRAIAAVLDTLDDAIQKTEQVIAKLKQVKQGLLHDLLTRGIDDNGELRDPERHPEQFQDSPLGRIPKGWEIACFEQQMASTTLGTARRGESPAGDNLRLLKMGNLDWGAVSTQDCELVSRKAVGDWRSLLLAPGDLLFNTRNTPELVGKTAAWREATDDVVSDNNIMRARFRQGTNGAFVAAFMSSVGRNSVSRLATGTTSVAAIYWRDLRRLRLPLPSGAEQNQIVERLDALDARVQEETAALVHWRALKAGLAEDLLTGRVRTMSLAQAEA